jgi:hypothetical protein
MTTRGDPAHDRTEDVPLMLRATVRGWLAQSDAMSALPGAPVQEDGPRPRRRPFLFVRRLRRLRRHWPRRGTRPATTVATAHHVLVSQRATADLKRTGSSTQG